MKISWLYKTLNDSKFKPFLGFANVVVDLCKYIESGSILILDLVVDLLKQYSNIVHKCPHKVSAS